MNKQKRKEAPQRKQKRTEAAQTRRAARAEAVKKRRQARAERREQRRAARRNASGLKKLLRGLFRLALAGALVCLIAFLAVVIRGGSRILDLKYNDERIEAGLPEEKADCILILGAGIRGGSPSPILRERLDLGAALYRAGAAPKILVTGDNGRTDYNEVQVMEDFFCCIFRPNPKFLGEKLPIVPRAGA